MTGIGKMDPDVKERWVKELRSGNYRQGKGVLRRRKLVVSDEFCCLGVLCDIAYQDGLVETEDDHGDVLYNNSLSFLPVEVQEWAGVERDGRFGLGSSHTLIYQNDEIARTFDEIADLVEKYL